MVTSAKCQRSPKQSHSGSPIWSQSGEVAGSLASGVVLRCKGSVGRRPVAGRRKLLPGALRPVARPNDLDKVGPVGQAIQGG